MEGQNDFFTLQSLGTFAGATGATVVISNSIQRVTNRNPAWLALLIAELICLMTVFWVHESAPDTTQIVHSDYFVAVVNGFLVFCSAAGSTAVGAAATGGRRQTVPAVARGDVSEATGAAPTGTPAKRHFFTPWI